MNARKKKARKTAASAAPRTRAVKIAVDFPASLFQETERVARELATSRSSVIRSAVEMFLRIRQREELERRIAESLLANAESDRRLMDEFQHVDAEYCDDAQ